MPNSNDSLFWLEQKCAGPCTNNHRCFFARKSNITNQTFCLEMKKNKNLSGSAQLQWIPLLTWAKMCRPVHDQTSLGSNRTWMHCHSNFNSTQSQFNPLLFTPPKNQLSSQPNPLQLQANSNSTHYTPTPTSIQLNSNSTQSNSCHQKTKLCMVELQPYTSTYIYI